MRRVFRAILKLAWRIKIMWTTKQRSANGEIGKQKGTKMNECEEGNPGLYGTQKLGRRTLVSRLLHIA